MKNKRMQKIKNKRMQEIKNKRKQKGCTVILGGENFHFAEKNCQLPSACLSFPNCYRGVTSPDLFCKGVVRFNLRTFEKLCRVLEMKGPADATRGCVL